GYEVMNERGSGSPLSLAIAHGSETVSQELNNYDFFTSAEVNLSPRFSLRPGARVSFGNAFDTQFMGSLSARHSFKNDWEVRAILGSANRTPSYDELYTELFHPSHNVIGNMELRP